MQTRNASIETSVSTELRAKDTILESTRVLKINVELAVQTVLRNGDSRANRSDVGIKDKSKAISTLLDTNFEERQQSGIAIS